MVDQAAIGLSGSVGHPYRSEQGRDVVHCLPVGHPAVDGTAGPALIDAGQRARVGQAQQVPHGPAVPWAPETAQSRRTGHRAYPHLPPIRSAP